MRWFDGISNSMYMGLSRFQELVMDRKVHAQSTGWQRVRHDYWVTEVN